ncbi:MAG: hypothetical protein K2Y37_20165 [Pirellulales bacterium]|nr:hypothetical protein [Pirellulales bacterium]
MKSRNVTAANVATGVAVAVLLASVVVITRLGEPGEYPVLAYSCCFAISLLAAVDLWRKRFWAAAVCGVGLMTSLLLLATEVIVADDFRPLTLQLSIPEPATWRKEASGSAHSIKVFWSEVSDGRSDDRRWELASNSAPLSFRSSTKVRVGSHYGYFVSHSQWYFAPLETILIVVDEAQRFRFDPDELFATDKVGDPPGNLAATIELDDYLSGAKRPPTLEFPETAGTSRSVTEDAIH